jgi:hypothetical protein
MSRSSDCRRLQWNMFFCTDSLFLLLCMNRDTLCARDIPLHCNRRLFAVSCRGVFSTLKRRHACRRSTATLSMCLWPSGLSEQQRKRQLSGELWCIRLAVQGTVMDHSLQSSLAPTRGSSLFAGSTRCVRNVRRRPQKLRRLRQLQRGAMRSGRWPPTVQPSRRLRRGGSGTCSQTPCASAPLPGMFPHSSHPLLQSVCNMCHPNEELRAAVRLYILDVTRIIRLYIVRCIGLAMTTPGLARRPCSALRARTSRCPL